MKSSYTRHYRKMQNKTKKLYAEITSYEIVKNIENNNFMIQQHIFAIELIN